MTLTHGLANLVVAIGCSADQVSDMMMRSHIGQFVILAVKIDDTGEVGWIADIHRISECLYTGLWFILACLQVFVNDVICIICSDETLYGQTHRMTEESRTDIAEITRWYTHYKILSFAESLHAGVGIEVIECLWQETGYIDGICRGQFHVLVQLLIHEG